MIQQNPRMHASELSDLTEKEWAGLRWPQARTRWGVGYAKPLEKAGLVKLEWYDHVYDRMHHGGGVLTLTKKGQEVARSGRLEKEPKA